MARRVSIAVSQSHSEVDSLCRPPWNAADSAVTHLRTGAPGAPEHPLLDRDLPQQLGVRRIVVIVELAGARRVQVAGRELLPGLQKAHGVERRAVSVFRVRVGRHVVRARVVVDEEHARADGDLDVVRADPGRRDRNRRCLNGGDERGRGCGGTAAFAAAFGRGQDRGQKGPPALNPNCPHGTPFFSWGPTFRGFFFGGVLNPFIH